MTYAKAQVLLEKLCPTATDVFVGSVDMRGIRLTGVDGKQINEAKLLKNRVHIRGMNKSGFVFSTVGVCPHRMCESCLRELAERHNKFAAGWYVVGSKSKRAKKHINKSLKRAVLNG